MTDKNTALVPEEGWHCLHLFYRVEHGQWQLLSREEQNAAKTNLARLVQEIRALDSTQLLTLSVVSPKADFGFMLITPDLQTANKIDKQLSLSLGADVLTPVYRDRKSTRLNSSHVAISYAVFCLKKKTTTTATLNPNVRN